MTINGVMVRMIVKAPDSDWGLFCILLYVINL